MGSRTLLELLAGRVDSKEFLRDNRHFASMLEPESNVFAAMLRRGSMITSVDVVRGEHIDDDILVFTFGAPDPALAALRIPDGGEDIESR